ncbi:hypothetical protein ABGV17_05900 [Guyparkeria sp. GHLCS8-2]|uniref:hypothetical protein n=1 Tax=Guyparkeria halopsychrophila TaxID=3139421 RepID=UPI0037CA44C2
MSPSVAMWVVNVPAFLLMLGAVVGGRAFVGKIYPGADNEGRRATIGIVIMVSSWFLWVAVMTLGFSLLDPFIVKPN